MAAGELAQFGEPTIDGAAEKIGVTRKTLYEWLKHEAFKLAVDQARKEYVESAFRTLRLAAKRAAEDLPRISEFGRITGGDVIQYDDLMSIFQF